MLHVSAQTASPNSIHQLAPSDWLHGPVIPQLTQAPLLFLTPFTEATELLSAFEQHLLPEDRPRIDFMKNERGRRCQIQTRATLRILFNSVLNRSDWTIRATQHEKPQLFLPVGFTPLHFNLSHSRRHLLIGLHPNHSIGVDIETPEREVKWEGVSRMVYTEAERNWIFADNSAHLRERFFRAWTCKEAVMKAEGAGFLKSPKRIEIDFESSNNNGDLPMVHYCNIDSTPSPGASSEPTLQVGAIDPDRPFRSCKDLRPE